METHQELADIVKWLDGEVETLQEENVDLKKNLDIWQFLKLNISNSSSAFDIDTQGNDEKNMKTVKLSAIFVNGIKKIAKFDTLSPDNA